MSADTAFFASCGWFLMTRTRDSSDSSRGNVGSATSCCKRNNWKVIEWLTRWAVEGQDVYDERNLLKCFLRARGTQAAG